MKLHLLGTKVVIATIQWLDGMVAGWDGSGGGETSFIG